jgi:hypothetical protein
LFYSIASNFELRLIVKVNPSYLSRTNKKQHSIGSQWERGGKRDLDGKYNKLDQWKL